MTLQEFTDRTGFYPDQALYEAIEARYIRFNGNTDAFCKAYQENKSGLAEAIQRAANEAISKMKLGYKEQITVLTNLLADKQKELDEARKALDRELEWKPYDGCGTNMSQVEYDELLESCTGMNGEPHFMGEEEAKRLAAEESGFLLDGIEIADTVRAYEVNRHGELREADEYKRPPLYGSSDHNYIRFNARLGAAIWRYEMINGELEEYCC